MTAKYTTPMIESGTPSSVAYALVLTAEQLRLAERSHTEESAPLMCRLAKYAMNPMPTSDKIAPSFLNMPSEEESLFGSFELADASDIGGGATSGFNSWPSLCLCSSMVLWVCRIHRCRPRLPSSR